MPDDFLKLVDANGNGDGEAFLSMHQLWLACNRMIERTAAPLSPARMIRPSALATWNAVKGGTDERSRALLKHFTRLNGAHPLVNIIMRLLMTLTINSAIAWRILEASRSGALPDDWKKLDIVRRGDIKG